VKPSLLLTLDDEVLADRAGDVALTSEELARVARLALLISARTMRRAGNLTPALRWEELGPDRQRAAALGAGRVIQALALLGYIDTDEEKDEGRRPW
jgi:hypothetical protein